MNEKRVSVLVIGRLAAWLYGRGLRALWAHAGKDRGVRRWQAVMFALGLLTVGSALAHRWMPGRRRCFRRTWCSTCC